MNRSMRMHRVFTLCVILVFASPHLAAQSLAGAPPRAPGQGEASVQLAAAIGIVKPRSDEKPSKEAEAPVSDPSDVSPPGSEATTGVGETGEAATSGKGVSKIAIGVGVGLAALLAAVAGGGGGGGNSTPTHGVSP